MGSALTPVPLLRLAHLSKRFGATQALDDVALEVAAGEVHGLLGHNGSGKSTLIRILAGYHAPDPGAEMALRGSPVALPLRPGQFRALGMAFVHQDPALLPALTVTENLRIGALAPRAALRRIDWAAERAAVAALLEEFGIACAPDDRVERLRPWQRPLLAILRAVDEIRRLPQDLPQGGAGLLVLDEPTAGIGDAGVERLFGVIRRVTAAGFGVLFVSHDLDEVITITDRVTVLRDGRVAGAGATAALDRAQLVDMIVGHPLARPARGVATVSAPLAAAQAVAGPGVRSVSFALGAGEILGATGLIGAGHAELGALLAGARPARGGVLDLGGRAVALAGLTPARAMAAGIAYVPAERLRAGCVGEMTVAENIALPVLRRLSRHLVLTPAAMARHAGALAVRFDIRPPDPALPLERLSGGNQQKVLMAKWLQLRPRLLVLEEPTQGVDVGAREQIFNAIRDWAASGAAVLVLSGDHEQLSLLCARVLIFRHGRIAAELAGADVTEERMAHACFGAVAA